MHLARNPTLLLAVAVVGCAGAAPRESSTSSASPASREVVREEPSSALERADATVREYRTCGGGPGCVTFEEADGALEAVLVEDPFSDDAFRARHTRASLHDRLEGRLVWDAIEQACPGLAEPGEELPLHPAVWEACPEGEGPAALEAWLQLGAFVGMDTLRRVIYLRALALAPEGASLGRLHYAIGEASYIAEHYADSLTAWAAIVEDPAAASYHDSAFSYAALMLTLWEVDDLWARPEAAWWMAREDVPRLLAAFVERCTSYPHPDNAVAAEAHERWLGLHPDDPRAPEVRAQLARCPR